MTERQVRVILAAAHEYGRALARVRELNAWENEPASAEEAIDAASELALALTGLHVALGVGGPGR